MSEKHRIGIISDTHGLLRPEVLEILKSCDAILHAGDITKESILDELRKLGRIYVIRGNGDKEWASYLQPKLSFELYGIRFFMIHNRKHVPSHLAGTDVVVYGHSHKYEEAYVDGKLWLNPGSCGPRRFTQPITMAVMDVQEDGTWSVRRVDVAHPVSGSGNKNDEKQLSDRIPGNIHKIIPLVMKDTDHGKTIPEIARKYGISEELAEQICRMYVTHPGVDVEGIMRRLGI